MVWPSVESMWHVMTHGGPWHARRLAFGDAHMDALRSAYGRALRDPRHAHACSGGGSGGEGRVRHTPRARLLVLRRGLAAVPGLRGGAAMGPAPHGKL
eukprot:352673-Chlamydomonas_euryale.AAC.4